MLSKALTAEERSLVLQTWAGGMPADLLRDVEDVAAAHVVGTLTHLAGLLKEMDEEADDILEQFTYRFSHRFLSRIAAEYEKLQ